jgi:glucosamine 6-phosphate synthetase-like amidotransferase/phosphosugar isomerase protein
LVTPGENYQSLLTSIREVGARGSPVFAIAEEGDRIIEQVANDVLYVSDQQEKVYDRAGDSDPASPQLQQLAAEQQALQKTLNSLDTNEGNLETVPFYSQQIGKLMNQAAELWISQHKV